jgi:hypothetical protein
MRWRKMSKPIITHCPKCGLPWNSEINSLPDIFNHPEVHRWIDRGFQGKTNWTVHTTNLPIEQQRWLMMDWALDEAIKIFKAMKWQFTEELRLQLIMHYQGKLTKENDNGNTDSRAVSVGTASRSTGTD